jgi:hypothetical protein
MTNNIVLFDNDIQKILPYDIIQIILQYVNRFVVKNGKNKICC